MADPEERDDAVLLSGRTALALIVVSSVVLAVWCVALMLR